MGTSKKKCIVCNQIKNETEFNREHVIPETIGGVYEIKSVCILCNERFGKKIDTPLVNHKVILINRHEYKLKRSGYRGIPNPFKGIYVQDNGEKYTVNFNQEGEATADILPKFEDNVLENNKRVGKLTIAKKDMDKIPRIINRELINRKLYMLDKIMPEPIEIHGEELVLIERTNNNPLIFGALKIAYEFCHEVVPNYVNDELSEKYRKVLLKPIDEDNIGKFLIKDEVLINAFLNRVLKIDTIEKHHHLIFLTPVKNRGTFCFIKLFQMTVLIKMSKKEMLENEVMLFNDVIQGKCGMQIPVNIKSFDVKLKLADDKSKPKGALTNDNGQTPVFNEKGEILYNHLDKLIGAEYIVPKRNEFISKSMKIRQEFSNNNFYLKGTDETGLLKIEAIEFKVRLLI